MASFVEELAWRGLLHQKTDEQLYKGDYQMTAKQRQLRTLRKSGESHSSTSARHEPCARRAFPTCKSLQRSNF